MGKKNKKNYSSKFKWLTFVSYFLLIALFLFSIIVFFTSKSNFQVVVKNNLGTAEIKYYLNDGESLLLTKYDGFKHVYKFNALGYIISILTFLSLVVVCYTLVYYFLQNKVILGKSKVVLFGTLFTMLLIDLILVGWIFVLTPFKSSSEGADLLNATIIPNNKYFGLIQTNGINNYVTKVDEIELGLININKVENGVATTSPGNMYYLFSGVAGLALLIYALSIFKGVYIILTKPINRDDNYYKER